MLLIRIYTQDYGRVSRVYKDYTHLLMMGTR